MFEHMMKGSAQNWEIIIPT